RPPRAPPTAGLWRTAPRSRRSSPHSSRRPPASPADATPIRSSQHRSTICRMENSILTEQDRAHLRHCVTLAREALAAGDEPLGSVLVDASGAVVHADLNRIAEGDPTAHPELALVRWAIAHMSPRVRARSTVYTSGEHCPMCAAAHAWAGLGRIVYAASSAQLGQWLDG